MAAIASSTHHTALSAKSRLYSIDALIVKTADNKCNGTRKDDNEMDTIVTSIPQMTAKPSQSVAVSKTVCDVYRSNNNERISEMYAKHASTPLRVVEQQTHSPQLPAPSPNYPVQSQIAQQHVAQVPNTNVPINASNLAYNNNLLHNCAPQVASQSLIKECDTNAKPLAHLNGDCSAQENNNNTLFEYVPNGGTIAAATFNLNHVKKEEEVTVEESHANDRVPDVQPKNISCANIESLTIPALPQSTIISMTTDETSNKLTKNTPCATTPHPSMGFVLNIPEASSWDTHLRSKIDLAAKRRQTRRELRSKQNGKHIKGAQETRTCRSASEAQSAFEFGIKVYGYSDTSSSSSDGEDDDWSSDDDSLLNDSHSVDVGLDLWILSRQKGMRVRCNEDNGQIEFLNIFGLTTHWTKNEIELKKLERRKWMPNHLELDDGAIDYWDKDDHNPRTDRLIIDLPVPSSKSSSSSLSHNQSNGVLNAPFKDGFLYGLGLKGVSLQQRQELEANWIHVVRNRMKRSCTTERASLNNYYLQFYDKLRETLPSPPPPSSSTEQRQELHRSNSGNIILTVPQIPLASIRNSNYPIGVRANGNECITTNVLTTIPHATLYVNDQTGSVQSEIQQPAGETSMVEGGIDRKVNLSWHGVDEIMACYTRYSKEREVEIARLKRKCFAQQQILSQRQNEARLLETRRTDLQKTSALCGQKRIKLEESIERLSKMLRDFTNNASNR